MRRGIALVVAAVGGAAMLVFLLTDSERSCNESLFDSPEAAVRAHISCREVLPLISYIECRETSNDGDTVTCTTGRHPDAFCQLRRTDMGLWWIKECNPAP